MDFFHETRLLEASHIKFCFMEYRKLLRFKTALQKSHGAELIWALGIDHPNFSGENVLPLLIGKTNWIFSLI